MRSPKDNPYDKTTDKPKRNFYEQTFFSKNKIYVKTFQSGNNKMWVFDRNKVPKDQSGNYIIDNSVKPERKISFNKFRSEAILIQRNEVLKRLQTQFDLSYKQAINLYEKNKEEIRMQRIEGIMAQKGMNRSNAMLYYNDLVDRKKFSELKTYANSPNLEVTYRF